LGEVSPKISVNKLSAIATNKSVKLILSLRKLWRPVVIFLKLAF